MNECYRYYMDFNMFHESHSPISCVVSPAIALNKLNKSVLTCHLYYTQLYLEQSFDSEPILLQELSRNFSVTLLY